MKSVDQIKQVAVTVVLAGYILSTMICGPIVVTHVPVEWSHCSHTPTHCGHKGNRPSRCAQWPLRQTNVVVPDTVQVSSLLNQKMELH